MMKWSKQKCRKVAFIVSVLYIILGCLYSLNIGGWDWGCYLSDIVLFVFHPILIVYLAIIFLNYSYLVLVLALLVLLLIIWKFVYSVLWFVKGDKNSEFK